MHMDATAGCMVREHLQRGIEAPVRRWFQLSVTMGRRAIQGGDSSCWRSLEEPEVQQYPGLPPGRSRARARI